MHACTESTTQPRTSPLPVALPRVRCMFWRRPCSRTGDAKQAAHKSIARQPQTASKKDTPPAPQGQAASGILPNKQQQQCKGQDGTFAVRDAPAVRPPSCTRRRNARTHTCGDGQGLGSEGNEMQRAAARAGAAACRQRQRQSLTILTMPRACVRSRQGGQGGAACAQAHARAAHALSHARCSASS